MPAYQRPGPPGCRRSIKYGSLHTPFVRYWIMSDCRVRCVIPPRAASLLPVRRLLASAGVERAQAEPFGALEKESLEPAVELRCSIEVATALVRQLCALRYTSVRYDTELLTACAQAVAALDEALDRATYDSFELV